MTNLPGQLEQPKSPGAPRQFGEKICSFCGSSSVVTKYTVGKHRILRCTACTLMWLYPRPDPNDLHSVYDESYFKNDNFFDNDSNLYGYADYSGERFVKQSAYLGMVREIKTYVKGFETGKSRLLDIGCGMGYLMDVAHDEGFQVAGVEFNGAAADSLRAKYTFPVYTGDVLNYNAPPFDVVTLMDVIEHFMDAEESIAHIAKLTKPDGIFVLSTMDCDGFVSKLLGTRIEDFRRVREHLFFFTRPLITELLHRHGFEVIKIEYHGHYFKLGFLANRLTLAWRPLGRVMTFLFKLLHVDQITIYLNPLTKMKVYARRRA